MRLIDGLIAVFEDAGVLASPDVTTRDCPVLAIEVGEALELVPV